MVDQRISEYAQRMIVEPVPANRGRRFYTEMPEHLGEKRVGERYHIVFVSYYADPHILKKALVLQKSGKVFLTLIAGCIREDAKVSDCFDQAYEYENFEDFFRICKSASPHSWHAVTPYYHSAILLHAGLKDSRLITDVVDASLFFFKEKNEDMIGLESAIMGQSHGVVHKIPDDAWGILEKEYGLVQKPHLKFYAYPMAEFSVRRLKKVRKTQDPPRLVYAGGIIPYDIAVSRGHENHIFDDLIAMTGPDTFDLTIYVNQNARDMPWNQHDHYYELEKRFPFFHFRKGLPYHQVAQELSNFSAGIFYDNIKHSSYNPDHFKYNIATKLFTYLEAKMPVIVYSQSECMADLVRVHDLGETYSIHQETTIIDAVNRISGKDRSDRIESFCRDFSCHGYLTDLLRIHGIRGDL
jgi:hypothetical protein